MAYNQNQVAIRWVVDEIENSVSSAVSSLESYLASVDNKAQLGFCRVSIHQVVGSLKMVDLQGAALLAEECELLANSLDEQSDIEGTGKVLLRALIQLPLYLNKVLESRYDDPSNLLPLLNDLRAARGKRLLTETSFFIPNLDPLAKAVGTAIAMQDDEFRSVYRKVAATFRASVTELLNDDLSDERLGALHRVALHLYKLTQGRPKSALAEIVVALTLAVKDHRVKIGYGVKSVFQQLSKYLVQLQQTGAHNELAVPNALVKNLLFYVHTARSYNKITKLVSKKYELDQSLLKAPVESLGETDWIGAPEQANIDKIISHLTVELSRVGQLFNAVLAGRSIQAGLFVAAKSVMSRAADTYAVLGDGQLRQLAIDLTSQIENKPLEPQDAEILNDKLKLLITRTKEIHVGTSEKRRDLDEREEQLQMAHENVLREVRNGLEQVKDAITGFVASQWEISHIVPAPGLLRSIRGGLEIALENRAAKVLGACARYIDERLLEIQETPDWQQMDQLADAISAIEFYVERMDSNALNENDKLLSKAEQSVAKLGFHVVPTSQLQEATPVVKEVEVHEDDQAVDDEVLEIFLEEVDEVLETITYYLPKWQNDGDQEARAEVRRAYHTLKGSGRMVGANVLAELCWSTENLLNRVIDNTVPLTQEVWVFIAKVTEVIPAIKDAFAKSETVENGDYIAQLEADGFQFAKGVQPSGYDEAVDANDSVDVENGSSVEAVEKPLTQLEETFKQEASSYLEELEQFIEEIHEQSPIRVVPSADLQRALHTLKGAASMTEIDGIYQVASALEALVKEQRAHEHETDDYLVNLYEQAASQLDSALLLLGSPWESPELVQDIETARSEIADQGEVSDTGQSLHFVDLLINAEFALIDSDNILELIDNEVDVSFEKLAAELNEIIALATSVNQTNYAQFASAILSCVEKLPEGISRDQVVSQIEPLRTAQLALIDGVDQLAAGQDYMPNVELIANLESFAWVVEDAAEAEQIFEVDEPLEIVEVEEALEIDEPVEVVEVEEALEAEETVEIIEVEETPEIEETLVVEEPVEIDDIEEAGEIETEVIEITPIADSSIEPTEQPVQKNLQEDEAVDLDIVEIFIDEAEELLEEFDEAIAMWQREPEAREPRDMLLRIMHTFKGGARLAGAMSLGNLAHDCETQILKTSASDSGANIIATVASYQDQMLQGVAALQGLINSGNAVSADDVAGDQGATEQVEVQSDDSDSQPQIPSEAVVREQSEEPVEESVGSLLPFEARDEAQQQAAQSIVQASLNTRHAGPQEVVKVKAELLEELVNLAGETSISRGRVEQQVNDVSFALDELDSIIGRLSDQVRRLDIETEAQILHRHDQITDETRDDFDPLEMDRYSQLQQLSRSLMESASDILDLKSTLSDKNKITETLLLQQSRVNSELQEGLMRSRMVPFSRVVPRLRRIVRQVGAELNKQVQFDIGRVDGEVDRSVLERLQSPLEHMLRNSIDHGIESAEKRAAANKDATGHVLLDLKREGGDVIVQIKDDGQGINLDAVRSRAISQGLLKEDQHISDYELQQLILLPGFSTASEVTQISGRGVGMDVVNSEIKHMGGSISIQSEPGKGTEITVRLPFTVSVNRALMVKIGESQYAIPLNSIEGIVRVSPYELELAYKQGQGGLEYGGRDYSVRYLGEMLHTKRRPDLKDEYMHCPVILVRAQDYSIAIHVDSLMGSREVVVKSLGPQFAAVPGLSGATVLGDGSVVVILDLLAMVRSSNILDFVANDQLVQPEQKDDRLLVMVVDDSLTVRKVTTRFLEREGMRVVTAKDGEDALKQLQDVTPDMMLLDIEMPKMDGYEVASTVKASIRWRDIPICMITSRTGDKHRRRALDMGVERYIGKPYQEAELLSIISELVGSAVES